VSKHITNATGAEILTLALAYIGSNANTAVRITDVITLVIFIFFSPYAALYGMYSLAIYTKKKPRPAQNPQNRNQFINLSPSTAIKRGHKTALQVALASKTVTSPSTPAEVSYQKRIPNSENPTLNLRKSQILSDYLKPLTTH